MKQIMKKLAPAFAQYISWDGFTNLTFIFARVLWISYCLRILYIIVPHGYDVEAHESYGLAWSQIFVIDYIAYGMRMTNPVGFVVWMFLCTLLMNASAWVWTQFHLWPGCLYYGTCLHYMEEYSFLSHLAEMDPWQFAIKCVLIWALLFIAGYWQWFFLMPWLIRKIFAAVATRLGKGQHKHDDKDINKDSSTREVVAFDSPVLKFMALLIHGCIFILYFCYLAEMWVYVVNDYISPGFRIYYTHPFIYALIFKVLFFAMILFIQSRLKYFSFHLMAQSILNMFLGVFVILNVYAVSVLYVYCVLWLMVLNYRKYFRLDSTAS